MDVNYKGLEKVLTEIIDRENSDSSLDYMGTHLKSSPDLLNYLQQAISKLRSGSSWGLIDKALEVGIAHENQLSICVIDDSEEGVSYEVSLGPDFIIEKIDKQKIHSFSQEELDNFCREFVEAVNCEKIQQVMSSVGWVWADSQGVPSTDHIRFSAFSILKDALKNYIKDEDVNSGIGMATKGFMAKDCCVHGEAYLTISFYFLRAYVSPSEVWFD